MIDHRWLHGSIVGLLAAFLSASPMAYADEDMEAGRPRQTMSRYQAVQTSVDVDYDDGEAADDYDYSSSEVSGGLGDAAWEESSQERSSGISTPAREVARSTSEMSTAGRGNGLILQGGSVTGNTSPPCAR